MTTHLIITHIPKDEKVLHDILKELGDNTWEQEGVDTFMNNEVTSTIFYHSKYECYMPGPGMGKTFPITTLHTSKPYWHIINRVDY